MGTEVLDPIQALGRPATYSEHPGMGHGFAFGDERDDEGNIHPEFYRSLQLTTEFLREWIQGTAR